MGSRRVLSHPEQVERRLILDLIARIASEDESIRERAADEVTDVHRALEDADVEVVAGVLIVARLVEPSRRCQEAQLHALAELAEWHDLRREMVSASPSSHVRSPIHHRRSTSTTS